MEPSDRLNPEHRFKRMYAMCKAERLEGKEREEFELDVLCLELCNQEVSSIIKQIIDEAYSKINSSDKDGSSKLRQNKLGYCGIETSEDEVYLRAVKTFEDSNEEARVRSLARGIIDDYEWPVRVRKSIDSIFQNQ